MADSEWAHFSMDATRMESGLRHAWGSVGQELRVSMIMAANASIALP